MSEYQKQNSKLVGRKWSGRIICKDDEVFIKTRTPHDSQNNNQYLVHIPELMPLTADQDEKDSAIYCFVDVGINSYRITASDARRPKETNGKFGTGYYGCYLPLHPNTFVEIEFKTENMNDGWITGILSYQEESNCVPFNHDLVDKDDVYLFMRTPRWDNMFALFEETVSMPYNSYHMVYNVESEDGTIIADKFAGTDPNTLPQTPIRTYFIVNSSKLTSDGPEDVDNGGIHFYTHDNVYGTIDENLHLAVNRNSNINFREDVYCHFRAFGKENITRITFDQNLDFYQRQHEESYDAGAGGDLPAKNDNPSSGDRLNKHDKITLDADVDLHITKKSANGSIKWLFDTTLDYINLKAVKIWFKDTLNFIVNLSAKIHLKDTLDIIVEKHVKAKLNDKLDFIITQAVTGLLKNKIDLTVDADMNVHIKSTAEILIDDNVALTIRESLDATIEKAVKMEIRDQMDLIVQKTAKITSQELLHILSHKNMNIESTDDLKISSNKMNSYSKSSTEIVGESGVTVEGVSGDVVIYAPGGSVVLKSSTGQLVI